MSTKLSYSSLVTQSTGWKATKINGDDEVVSVYRLLFTKTPDQSHSLIHTNDMMPLLSNLP